MPYIHFHLLERGLEHNRPVSIYALRHVEEQEAVAFGPISVLLKEIAVYVNLALVMRMGVLLEIEATGLVVKDHQLPLPHKHIVNSSGEDIPTFVLPLEALPPVPPGIQQRLIGEQAISTVKLPDKLWRELVHVTIAVEVGLQDGVHPGREGGEDAGGTLPHPVLVEPEAARAVFHERQG